MSFIQQFYPYDMTKYSDTFEVKKNPHIFTQLIWSMESFIDYGKKDYLNSDQRRLMKSLKLDIERMLDGIQENVN